MRRCSSPAPLPAPRAEKKSSPPRSFAICHGNAAAPRRRPVWFDSGPKLPAIYAARAKCADERRAAASDDSDLRNIVHAGTPLTATALALAEQTGATGKDVLTAMVVGYEAAGRIGASVTNGINNLGFHGCLGAAFGAAAAAAKLLQLDATQASHTLVLTATSMGGMRAAANTSFSREYHAGAGDDGRHRRRDGRAKRLYGRAWYLRSTEGLLCGFGGSKPATVSPLIWVTNGISSTDMAVKTGTRRTPLPYDGGGPPQTPRARVISHRTTSPPLSYPFPASQH